jgi:hypothetical protein
LSKYHLIPEEITKRDSANKTAKLQQIRKTDDLNFTLQHMQDIDEILYMFFVNEEKLNSCPRVPICIGNQHIPSVIDTGSQISLLMEELYHRLRSKGVEGLELGAQNTLLVSVFGNKTKHIRT